MGIGTPVIRLFPNPRQRYGAASGLQERNRMKTFVGAMIAIALLASPQAIAATAEDFEDLASFIRESKDATAHPSGTAVVVVRKGRVVYEGYFGFADIGARQPVTRDTAFYIASTTKPFLALGVLLNEHAGRLDTRTSLQEMFPEARFEGFDATSVTAKDLLVHSSGIDNLPLVWATAFSGIHDPQSRRALVAASYPGEQAHGTFKYSNVGYNILSVWLDRKLAMPWQDQLRDTVFAPLGMTRTSARISEAEARGWPLAQPYSFASAQPNQPLYLRKSDQTMHAAGGLVSTAPDLAKFLIAQLGDGQYRGRQVFPASVLKRAHAPQATLEGRYLDFERTGYAWGWYSGEYKGHRMLHHFGSFAGFHAHLSFMPERDIGLVVLNNEDMLSTRLTALIADYVYGVLLDEADIGAKTEARFGALHAQAKQLQSKVAQHREEIRKRETRLSLPVEAYVGTYTHEWLGPMAVALNADRELVIRWGRVMAVAAGHDRPDHVRVEFAPNSGDVLSFETKDGDVAAIAFAGARFEKAR